MNDKIEELRSALKLAGKLAISARLVINSDARNLSQRIKDMEDALKAYDDKIMNFRS